MIQQRRTGQAPSGEPLVDWWPIHPNKGLPIECGKTRPFNPKALDAFQGLRKRLQIEALRERQRVQHGIAHMVAPPGLAVEPALSYMGSSDRYDLEQCPLGWLAPATADERGGDEARGGVDGEGRELEDSAERFGGEGSDGGTARIGWSCKVKSECCSKRRGEERPPPLACRWSKPLDESLHSCDVHGVKRTGLE